MDDLTSPAWPMIAPARTLADVGWLDISGRADALLHRLIGAAPAQSTLRFYVPGRVEFLGKHTDYAGGRSLLAAVERGFAFAAAPRDDRTVRIADPNGSAPVVFALDAELNVVAGHCVQLCNDGCAPGGEELCLAPKGR